MNFIRIINDLCKINMECNQVRKRFKFTNTKNNDCLSKMLRN